MVPQTVMATKKKENPMINVPKISEDTDIRVDIFIWENKYKESKRKEATPEKKKTYSIPLQNFTPEL